MKFWDPFCRMVACMLLMCISLAPLPAQTPLSIQVQVEYDADSVYAGLRIIRLFEGDSLYLPNPQTRASYIAYAQDGNKLYLYQEFERLDEPMLHWISCYDLRQREVGRSQPRFMGQVKSMNEILPGAWYTLFSVGNRIVPVGDITIPGN